jgi:hypothetical protein
VGELLILSPRSVVGGGSSQIRLLSAERSLIGIFISEQY